MKSETELKLETRNSTGRHPVEKFEILATGFTMAEILVVIAIIAVLLGVLMPALNQVKKVAKEAKQKAQIYSMEVGIESYKGDFGGYPLSHSGDANGCTCPAQGKYSYTGAQTLAEAMFGQDFLGVHPATAYRADGNDLAGIDLYPDSLDPDNDSNDRTNLESRKGPYLDRTNIDVFTPAQIFETDTCSMVEPDKYAICDVFGSANRTVGGKRYKVGTPILYFRANESAPKTQLTPSAVAGAHADNIYNYADNRNLMSFKRIADDKEHPLAPIDTAPTTSYLDGSIFYDFIKDPMVPAIDYPVRPDSFILISAGYDGLYGTRDDICNFKPNIE